MTVKTAGRTAGMVKQLEGLLDLKASDGLQRWKPQR
jgi:hypothetical protein